MKALIFDIDGTLANCDHRLYHLDNGKDWKGFFGDMHLDTAIGPIAWLARFISRFARAGEPVEFDGFKLNEEDHVTVLIVTARPDESNYRQVTEKWLADNEIYYDKLYMRKGGDWRADQIVKREILEEILADGYDPFMAIDDRPQVVEMWRSFGLMCLQCAPDPDTNRCRTEDSGKVLFDMLVGPAGAGKSTYTAKHYQPGDVISSDEIRRQLYGDHTKGHDPDELARTWKYIRSLIRARLENGVFTVLDATNIKRKDRLNVLSIVPKGLLVQYVVLDRDYDAKIRDRGWRPESLIDKHHSTFKSNLKDILNADGQGNVLVKDVREKKL